jgi:CBS domain containing-hemolysin-like protein
MEIGVIILCLILSAFFFRMEIAFISSNKIYLEIEEQDNFLSKILINLLKNHQSS